MLRLLPLFLLPSLALGDVVLRNGGTTQGAVAVVNCGGGLICSKSGNVGTIAFDGGLLGGGGPALPGEGYVLTDGGSIAWAHGLTCSAGYALTTSGTGAMACTNSVSYSSSASYATYLASDPTACSSGWFVNDIGQTGATYCAAVTTASLSGTISDAQLANNYSGTGTCGANLFVTATVDNAGPSCVQPAFSNLTGTASAAQGGFGAAMPTCASSAYYLTCNGSSCSCVANYSPTFGTPSTVGTSNSAGSGTQVARDNHVHAHGNQTDELHHAIVTTTTNGFMSDEMLIILNAAVADVAALCAAHPGTCP